MDSGSTSCRMLAQHEQSWYTQSPQLKEQCGEASQGAATTQQHAKNKKNSHIVQQAMHPICWLCHDATKQISEMKTESCPAYTAALDDLWHCYSWCNCSGKQGWLKAKINGEFPIQQTAPRPPDRQMLLSKAYMKWWYFTMAPVKECGSPNKELRPGPVYTKTTQTVHKKFWQRTCKSYLVSFSHYL